MLSLCYAAPHPQLHGYIASYYLFRADLPEVEDMVRADLPQLRFVLSGSAFYTFNGGNRLRCPDAMLTGTTTSAVQFNAKGPLLLFGIGILPRGWTAIVGSSAAELSDQVEDANAVFGHAANDMLDMLHECVSFNQMVAIADLALRARIQKPLDQSTEWFTEITNAWLISEASPRVDVLVRETGLSGRQIERLANRMYGAPPKLLARKYRALRLAWRLALQDGHWNDLMGDAFYDQSHFIRDFKQFTGQTPRQFQLNPSPLTTLISGRRALIDVMPRFAHES